jgi:predicted RNA binding protein YcfA (HicA-like mRNA interferase family)
MPDLPAVSGKAVIAALAKAGFEEQRVKGSHHILKKPGHVYNISVPVHGNRALRQGTLRNIIRSAGLTVEEFVELLG